MVVNNEEKGKASGAVVRVGGPVKDAQVSLRVIGHLIDAAMISRLLGCDQSRVDDLTISNTKDPRGDANRLRVLAISRDLMPGSSIDVTICELLAELTSDMQRWKAACNQWRIDLFCGLFLDEQNRGFVLHANTLRAIADRSIEIGFDIYCPPSHVDRPAAIGDK